MKKNYFLILLFFSTFIFSQQKIFQTKLDEGNLTIDDKITAELASNYVLTQYYKQPPFDLTVDLEIILPTGRIIQAKKTKKYSYTNNTVSYVYSVEQEPNSDLVLSKSENIVTGIYVGENGEKVVFHQTRPNIFAVSEVNQPKLDLQEKKDDYIVVPNLGNKNNLVNPDICNANTPPCPATVIDVMVLYTTAAKNIWGGSAQSNANAATAITNFNISLNNSGVSNTTMNLVYSGEVLYTESGNINTDLDRLATSGDGYLDVAQTLRTTYGADLVSLITTTPDNICGLAHLNTTYSNSLAYSISLYDCAIANFTLAHELGHSMGLNHDWYVNPSTTPCANHHGYVNQVAISMGTAAPSNKRWRTILAYSDQCGSVNIDCTRINRWANPEKNYNGDPTGKPMTDAQPSNEAFAFSRFACIVSNYMPTAAMATDEVNGNVSEFIVYPNPAIEMVNITIKNNKEYIFKIYNTAGQIILITKQKKFSVAHWTKGSYIIAVYDNENNMVATKKFIAK